MIDIEKFICSLLNRASGLSVIKVIDILDALNNQGLKYKDGKIIPIDNKPKFKVGDWVINKFGNVWHIDSFDNKNYQVSNGDRYCYFQIEKQNEMHLWTIEDAKDGDVLACGNDIVIFKENTYSPKDKLGCMFVYCSCNNFYEFRGINPTTYKPATKKQRDILFQKMKEAGYIFDKDLKKIKQEESIEFKRGYRKAIEDTKNWLQFRK